MIIQGDKTFSRCRTCHTEAVVFEGAECSSCQQQNKGKAYEEHTWWKLSLAGMLVVIVMCFISGCTAAINRYHQEDRDEVKREVRLQLEADYR